jgi:hypothetical protein
MVDKQSNGQALTCEHVWHEISNYLENDVDAGLRAAMDDHFHTCKRCTSVLEGTRNVIRLYGDERMMEVPAGFGRRLEKRLAQSSRVSRQRWSTWSAWLVPVAALALITASVWLANSWTTTRRDQSQMAAIERNIPPDMKVVVSEGAKLFHVAGCDYIHNKDKVRTLTAKEAIQQGYTPCLRCLRKYVDTTAAIGHTALGMQAKADADADAEEEKREGGQ